MASLTLNLPDDFQRSLLDFADDIEQIAGEMLRAGAKPVEAAVKKRAERHVNTGAMLSSVKTFKPLRGKDGVWTVRVGFTGKGVRRHITRRHYIKRMFFGGTWKISNAYKAFLLEYGSSHQPATPFIRPALADSKEEAVAEMQDVFNWHLQLKNIPHLQGR